MIQIYIDLLHIKCEMASEDGKPNKAPKGEEPVSGGKAAAKDKTTELEAPPAGEELLSLLEDVSEIDRSSALREIKVSGETLDMWVDELSKGGWVWVVDRELGEYYVGLTDKSRDMINQLKEQRKKEESTVTEKPAAKKASIKLVLARFKGAIKAFLEKISSLLSSNVVDLSILAGLVTFVYLLYRFFENPNLRILNFLASVVLFSQILFTYRNSRKKLKTTNIMEDLNEVSKLLTRNWRGAIFAAFALLLIYFVGWAIIFPPYRAISILLCAMLVSFILQLYYPLEPMSKIPRFYFGTLLLVYSMLLILGTTRITHVLLESENRYLDVGAGILLLSAVYMKRDFFGIEPSYFNRILSKQEEERLT